MMWKNSTSENLVDNLFIQRGENIDFPKEIYVWRLGMKVPTWLSDLAKVKFMDAEGNLTLDYTETNMGGIEILESGSINVLVRLGSRKDYVCSGKGVNLFSLTPRQLNLLYKKRS